MAASLGRLARSAAVYSSRQNLLRGHSGVARVALANATRLQVRREFSAGCILSKRKTDNADPEDEGSHDRRRKDRDEEAMDAGEDVAVKSSKPASKPAPAAPEATQQPISRKQADQEFEQLLKELPENKRQQLVAERDRILANADSDEFWQRLGKDAERRANQLEREHPEEDLEKWMTRGREPEGFLQHAEEDPFMTMDDPVFEEDDISILAHAELEEHREYRHYVRLAAWEMPLLTKLATKYVKPDKSKPLRFRYTTYLGDQHPSEQKVVMEFVTGDLGLSQKQREKLVKLVGARYNPQTDTVRMSCEMFETSAQNKKFLKDTLAKVIQEAKSGKDTLEDIPLDFRHHKFKHSKKFPREWALSPERLAQLEGARDKQRAAVEADKLDGAFVLDGPGLIAKHLATLPAEAAPTVQPGSRGGRGARR